MKRIAVGSVIGMSKTNTAEKEYTVFPFGPQHPNLPEPLQLRFIVDEEEIVDVVPQLGYVHRGIERAAELNDYRRNIYLCSRICGICNFIHARSYSEVIEKIMDVEVPIRAKYLRTIWTELSRLQSHLLWLGLYADAVGFESLFMQAWRDREIVLSLNEKTNGHRIHLDTCVIGGVRRDLDDNLIRNYRTDLTLLREKMMNLAPVIYKDKAFRNKCMGKGVLSKGDAHFLGACGPVIRGSGVPQDMRNLGHAAYGELDFKPVVYNDGDSYARCLVRYDEVLQSIDLMERALDQLPNGPIAVNPTGFPDGIAIHRTEQPRGELFYYVEGNGTMNLQRCKIRTPTMANIPALAKILIGYDIADIPTIVHSIDPCISCTERFTQVKRGA